MEHEPYTLEHAAQAMMRFNLHRLVKPLKITLWTLGSLACLAVLVWTLDAIMRSNHWTLAVSPHVVGRVLLGVLLVVFTGGGTLIWRNRR